MLAKNLGLIGLYALSATSGASTTKISSNLSMSGVSISSSAALASTYAPNQASANNGSSNLQDADDGFSGQNLKRTDDMNAMENNGQ
jgi:hypothetical protein